MIILSSVALAIAAVGTCCGDLRFWRVAQREHYLVGETAAFGRRWWQGGWDSTLLFGVGMAGAIATAFVPAAAIVPGLVAVAAPLRLSLRGRTGRLSWTRRLATLAGVTVLLEGAGAALGALGSGLEGATLAVALESMLTPLFVDAALVATRPLEEAMARRFVEQARARLERVHPLVVAVTGSYGKTTVKGYIAHLVGSYKTTLPSPKSFNNRAGLARTVNEHLGPATEVLVAEMGTYGPGEIAEMCSWMRPQISVMTAIGPAHLQRFKSLDNTLRAKAEITETAQVVVLNADDERLAAYGRELAALGEKRVLLASGRDGSADVAVVPGEEGLALYVAGEKVGLAAVGPGERPTAASNAACAAAVALELGVPAPEVLARLASLPLPANRLQRYRADGGYLVYDDTFNSNPTGARLALQRLAEESEVSPGGRRVVVTPGMVELGPEQARENESFGAAAAAVADRLFVVARTNRAALLRGARQSSAEVVTVDRLDQAIAWVRDNLGPGDAVLYENDLPDHYL